MCILIRFAKIFVIAPVYENKSFYVYVEWANQVSPKQQQTETHKTCKKKKYDLAGRHFKLKKYVLSIVYSCPSIQIHIVGNRSFTHSFPNSKYSTTSQRFD